MAAGEFGKKSCEKCKQDPRLKEAWACEPSEEAIYALYPGTPKEMLLYRCPLRECGRDVREALFLHRHYRAGTLGSVCERLPLPASAIEAFQIIDSVLGELMPDAN